MRAPAPTAILFDMDGVLVRSEEIWFHVVEEAGRRFRGTPVTREEFTPTFGQGTRADLEVFGLRCTVPELDRFYAEYFRQHVDEVWVDPDAASVLQTLRARGLRLGVVTNTVTDLAEAILRTAGLRDHVDVVSCADQVPLAKPAPDLILHGLTAVGVDAAHAWVVGDSRYDQEAARAASVFFVGYGRDGDVTVQRLPELLPLLDAAG